VSLYNCDFKSIYPRITLKYSFYGLPLSSLPRKITYIQTVLHHKRSQIWLFRCRYFLPMPQLTPDCNRVVVCGLPPSDGTDFNTEFAMRLLQMIMEIRISDDYCLSDIYVIDYGNITLRHISKMTPSLVKKFELCVLVSSTQIFWLYKDNRAQ